METGSIKKRKQMVVKTAKPSIRKQCKLLSISRGSLYIKSKGESEKNQEYMRLMYEHHLQHPYKGVLQMQDFLQLSGKAVNEKRVR